MFVGEYWPMVSYVRFCGPMTFVFDGRLNVISFYVVVEIGSFCIMFALSNRMALQTYQLVCLKLLVYLDRLSYVC